jgi:hypothetical protein
LIESSFVFDVFETLGCSIRSFLLKFVILDLPKKKLRRNPEKYDIQVQDNLAIEAISSPDPFSWIMRVVGVSGILQHDRKKFKERTKSNVMTSIIRFA